jgi:hypothetical protein
LDEAAFTADQTGVDGLTAAGIHRPSDAAWSNSPRKCSGLEALARDGRDVAAAADEQRRRKARTNESFTSPSSGQI